MSNKQSPSYWRLAGALKVLRNTAMLGLAIAVTTTVEGQIRTYDVNFASVAPTVDGVISDGEWDTAAGRGGDWVLLRTGQAWGDLDNENNRFRALWDDDGFYLLAESDYRDWAPDQVGQAPAAADFNADMLNVFFDPNTLGEDNAGQLDAEVDNYQFSFNVYADQRSCGGDRVPGTPDDCTQEGEPRADNVSVTGLTFGTLTAAHADGLFNNDAGWEHLRGTHISFDISEDDGAVIEMFVPWDDFDADAVAESTGIETGLHHPFAPSVNDVWFFNVTRQSSNPDNFLPVWNWTKSQFFASHGEDPSQGHGEIRFVGGVSPSCDFDGSSTCDIGDIDALLQEGQANQDLTYDLTADGIVNLEDRDEWYSLASAERGVELVAGDANLDGQVKADDLNALGANWLRDDATSIAQGDFNGDGGVNPQDLNEIGRNWQHGVPVGASPVPEPSGLTLLLAAFLFGRDFICQRSRKR